MDSLERIHRLQRVRDLVDQDFTDSEISETLGVSVRTIQRLKRDLRDLYVSDLTPVTVAGKRAEVYLELSECMSEAKKMYDQCVEEKNYMYAKQFLGMWLSVIQQKAKVFGLENSKPNTAIQINSLSNPVTHKIDYDVGKEISDDIKNIHEDLMNGK